jgi:Tfp pilus assembly protein PilF
VYTYLFSQLPKLALHNANKAIEVDKENAKAYLRRAQALMETKDFEGTLDDWAVILASDRVFLLCRCEKGHPYCSKVGS